jgi:hypothetical protein
MVGGSIALDAKEIPARAFWIDNRQVHEKPRFIYLAVHFIAQPADGGCHLAFEFGVVIAPAAHGHIEFDPLGKAEKRFLSLGDSNPATGGRFVPARVCELR